MYPYASYASKEVHEAHDDTLVSFAVAHTFVQVQIKRGVATPSVCHGVAPF